MPRVKLPSPERRRRATARKNRWRQQLALPTRDRTPPSSLNLPPKLPLSQPGDNIAHEPGQLPTPIPSQPEPRWDLCSKSALVEQSLPPVNCSTPLKPALSCPANNNDLYNRSQGSDGSQEALPELVSPSLVNNNHLYNRFQGSDGSQEALPELVSPSPSPINNNDSYNGFQESDSCEETRQQSAQPRTMPQVVIPFNQELSQRLQAVLQEANRDLVEAESFSDGSFTPPDQEVKESIAESDTGSEYSYTANESVASFDLDKNGSGSRMAAHLAAITLESEEEIDFAKELARHFTQFVGCGAEAHSFASQQHCPLPPGPDQSPHLSLSDYCQDLYQCHIPDVISRAEVLLHDQLDGLPTPDWARAFEGQGPNPSIDKPCSPGSRAGSAGDSAATRGQILSELCLPCSQIQDDSPAQSFDIDSFVGYASSLGFARQGLDVNFFPRFHTNIHANQHIYTTVYHDFGKGEKPIRVKLHHVPHYRLGRVTGQGNTNVYIFFPRMYNPKKQTNFPGGVDGEASNILRTWTDQILIPALFRHILPSNRQNYPVSWEQARLKSRAYFKEVCGGSSKETQDSQAMTLHYTIPASSLVATWEDIRQQLCLPKNRLYSQAQLYFTAKNSKLQFTSLTFQDTWAAFNTVFSTIYEPQFLNRSELWVDVGRQLTGTHYTLPSEQAGPSSQPTVYLFKSCCAQSLARWAAFKEPNRPVIATTYTTALLRDASNLTVEMSPSSRQRREGWLYIQAYNSIKETYDAAKTKPFCSKSLAKLAWDPEVMAALKTAGKGGSPPATRLLEMYLESKQRLFSACKASSQMSFGYRLEHRLSLDLVDRIAENLQASGEWETNRPLNHSDLEPVWQLSTYHYTQYQLANANKYMAIIEWIRAIAAENRISHEHCKILTMFLLVLPFTFDSALLQRHNEVWKASYQQRRGKTKVTGMGLQDTLLSSGYAWLLPRIDWEKLAFRNVLSMDMAFTSSMLRDTYRTNWLRVKTTKDELQRLEIARRWLSFYCLDPVCKRFIFRFLILIVIRSYRKEIFKRLQSEIDPSYYSEASKGVVTCCQHEIRRIFRPELPPVTIIDGARSKLSSVRMLVDLLWGLEPDRPLAPWDSLPFRLLYREAVDLVQKTYGRADSIQFRQELRCYFVSTHWLIPYPTGHKFFQRNHKRKLLWIALSHYQLYDLLSIQGQPVRQSVLNPTQADNKIGLLEIQSSSSSPLKESEFFGDWYIQSDKGAPLLQAIPLDWTDKLLHPDAEIDTITAWLERNWQRYCQQNGHALESS